MPKGTGVSEGIGIASALVWYQPVSSDYVPRKSASPEEERGRFDSAVHSLLLNIDDMRQKTARQFGDDEAAIFDAYAMMLRDTESLTDPIREMIRQRSLSAEYAVNLQFGDLARHFLEMKNEYMQQRAEDVFSLRDQLLREMMGIPVAEATHLDRPTVVVAGSLSPADIANLDLSRLEGIICGTGGYSSHMAIICRTLGIPAVVGVAGIQDDVEDGQLVALDGGSGEIWVRPDVDEIEFLRRRADSVAEQRRAAQLFRGRPTLSTDGHRVELSADIGQMEEIDAALAADAESLGLFRTEMLQINPHPFPDEDQQFEMYCELLRRLNGKSVTVRTFDDGGNRPVLGIKQHKENNPVLGYRGIRMSLGRPSFFRTQLRALLRASAYGNLKVLFPMISNLDEMDQVLAALDSIKRELRREGIPFDERMQVGVAIGVPASALLAAQLAERADFFMVSINELVQFTLAVDRGNPDLAYLYHQYHPAVLRLIRWTVDAAHAAGITCGVSGDAPGHQQVLPLLFGMGLDGFSMNPGLILASRQQLNSLSYADCRRMADEVLEYHSTEEVARMLLEFSHRND